ncbi:siroheme synthase CysG [Methylophaga sulfidovorans]|uniref:Siroheme synthase n=1 Tax=Methylophaga sulfidovorans TaxID=45496 RepID=A0A1I3VP44_9GAMM|nr:siroheme synthase CysG [Methylophaga sulfidovorans]SFJ95931.1 uroporphyrinogen-III C-methyltransferase [Methylophaga sulfidovorans]
MDYLPIFLDLKQQHCLVIGGGSVATRKSKLLLKAQATVTVVSPEITDALKELVQQGQISWVQSLFSPTQINDQRLVIAATDDEKINQAVHEVAQQKNILTNLTDNPDGSDFIFASVLDRSPIIVAVSSGGESPVLARNLRARLETLIPPAYSKLGELMGKYRGAVKQKFGELRQRRQFWDTVLSGPVADHVMAGREGIAEQILQQQLADESETVETGEVFLVGAGPGDPELLTFKALRLMQQADIVFYDRLVSKEILALARKEAELVYVGKQRAWHAVRQEEINNLLLEHAKQGKRVLRLKGGDPFIFGRGGEEIDTLAENNIPFQVVPGITAASGCASYAGIPLTHRDYAQSCIFVTGQLKEGELNLNWSVLVKPKQTVVVYMGLAGLSQLSQKLQEHGMPADMPAALVQQGTTENQKVWLSTIDELPELAEREKPIAPTLLIIGEVTKLHDKLAWFKSG